MTLPTISKPAKARAWAVFGLGGMIWWPKADVDRFHGGRDQAQVAALTLRMRNQRSAIRDLEEIIVRQERRIMDLGG